AERLAAGRAALASLDEVSGTADRILAAFGPDVAARPDVVWMDRPPDGGTRRPPTLRIAPLGVGPPVAGGLFCRQTVVLTSATLALGGSFEPLARQWGLPPPPAAGKVAAAGETTADEATAGETAAGETAADDTLPSDGPPAAPAGLAWS